MIVGFVDIVDPRRRGTTTLVPRIFLLGNECRYEVGNNILCLSSFRSVVVNIADGRPKVRFILAVDDSKNTLEEIVKVISQNLGTGKVQHISREDALLNKELSVRRQ